MLSNKRWTIFHAFLLKSDRLSQKLLIAHYEQVYFNFYGIYRSEILKSNLSLLYN